ncbi:cobalt-precorrin 4 C11-methyltransferase CbiF (plasmid) [Peptoclostridium acidaminophilum DSM 3953]|uniref:Cobalt-precorrin 4 C11-methyltransferase CbiF n=2 Tax=Peptoclostridium acidaminophilum TaxID=1731 RepID=W8T9L4_PEPAC|nr:cobalt-precorrin 4 C11-methyltransferase CbiF [Peptoclostridium acidaminophilum DSM 3953]
MMGKVHFIGAGPGDPELLTIKGKRLLEEADVIIYAGSLVNPQLLEAAKPGCSIYDSAGMTLEQVIETMREAAGGGMSIARLHTGDPSIYGAIREQIDELDRLGIECEVVPGVSSFTASAAALKKEFTLPDISQTVICTRLEGRTPVPESESLESLASHRASMAIFLSVHMIDEVARRLIPHYGESAPVAIVQKASWSDQKIVTGTLSNIAKKAREAGIEKTAQILVGEFLGDEYSRSKLYDPDFSHGYRGGNEK